MSTVVDERVVSMQFDNKRFEQNVATTMSTLDKLKLKLNLQGATKGLEGIDKAAKQCDVSPIGAAVEKVGLKFNAMYSIADQALRNITNRAMAAGESILKSLTIDPIKTGLQEYETQINAVQTILANTQSKGTTLEDVNAALDELNTYADKTIYNFTEMTRNIGTFTAAGVDLDTATNAIQGIANLAAVSGSTSQQASTAMYQLSQALASGTVKLMDWNSVVNAGMGGQVFQDALKETAREHGIAIDDIIKKQGSFRDSLKDEWLTSEILTDTLSKFTDETTDLGKTAIDAATKVKTFSQLLDTLKESAQSGWTQTWETIIGDFEEAKSLWTNVSDVLGGIINRSSEARNSLIKGAFGSGWDNFLEQGIFDEKAYSNRVKEVAKDHGIAIDKMIKEEGSLEKALRKGFSEGTISSDILSESLNSLANTYKNVSDAELKNLGYTRDQVNALLKFNEQIQNGEKSIDGFAEGIEKLSGRELLIQSFSNIFKALVSVITPIKDAFREIFPPATSDQLYGIIEGFKNFTEKLILSEERSEKLKQTFKGLFAIFDIILTVIKTVVGTVVKLLGNFSGLIDVVLNITSALGGFILGLRSSIKESNTLSKISEVTVKTVSNVVEVIKQFANILKEKFQTTGLDGFVGVLKGVWNVVKTIIGKIAELFGYTFTGNGDILGTLMNIFNAGLLTTLIVKLKNLTSIFDGIADVFKETASGFGEALKTLTGPLQGLQDKLKAEALKKIATAIAIVAASLLVLSLIEKDKLEGAIAAMAISLGVLMGALAIMGKMGKDKVKGVAGLIAISSSLLILSLSLKLLASMSWEEIGKALVAVSGSLAILMSTLALTALISKIGKNDAVKQLNKIVKPLLLLSVSLKILATMSWDDIGRALAAMGGALGILSATLALTTLISKIGSDSAIKNIFKMSVSLILVASSLKILATMSWEEIGRALGAMGGALGVLAVTMAITTLISKMGSNKTLGQIVVISNSLMVLALTLKLFATMSWEEIGRGLVAMVGVLGTLVGALALLSLISKISGNSGMILAATSILIMSTAIATLIPTLAILGNMKTETIVKGLLTIAAALTILGVAGIVLKTAVPAILALSGSLALMGASLFLIGAGISLIGVGLAALVTSIAALLTAVVAGGTVLVNTVASLAANLIKLIPAFLVGVAQGLVVFCAVLADGAPVIGKAIASVLVSAIQACVTVIPELASGLLKILLGVLGTMTEYIPQIVEKLVDMLISVIKSISQFLPKLILAAVEVFSEFFTGVVEALKNMDTSTLLKAIAGVGLIAGLIVALGAIVPLIPGAMLGVLGVSAVVAEIALVIAAIGALSKIPGFSDLVESGGNLLQKLGTAIGQFVGGLIGGIGKGITSSLPAMATDLSNFMTNLKPFINGMRSIDSSLLESGKTLASLLLTITGTNIVQQLTSWLTGGTSMSDFAKEIAEFGKGMKQFGQEVSGIDGQNVKAAAEAGKTLGQMAKNIPTSGGLWDLIAGKNDLEAFGDQLGGFGSAIKQFAKETAGLSLDVINIAVKAGNKVANMAQNMPTSGGLWSAGSGSINTLSSQLQSFGTAIKNFVDKVNSAENVSAAISKIKTLTDMLNKFSINGVKSIITAFNTAKVMLGASVKQMFQIAITIAKVKTKEFILIIKNMMKQFVLTVKASKQPIMLAFEDTLESTVNIIKTPKWAESFKGAGKFAVQGFAAGISQNTFLAEAKSAAMASAALNAAKEALDEHSPSKEFYNVGYYGGIALVNALSDLEPDAYSAGYSMAARSVFGLEDAISKASDVFENNTEYQPTIKPVLDLSAVIAGANSIGNMFNMAPSVGVLSNISSISNNMNRNQNGVNDDVIKAIKELKTTVENTPHETIQVGNVSYNAGGEVEAAVNELIRAIKLEGRR